MASVSSTNNAEPSTSGSAAKKRKTELPGTSNENANDADTGYPSTENAIVHRPLNHTTGNRFVFAKHHTLVSYGVANIQLQLDQESYSRVGSTSLMYLPVDRPWFYLSPSEYLNILAKIRGVRVTEVKVRVTMRNPRTAFETNSSTSQLATLNQNKFALVGKGLTNITRGINCHLEFNASNVMKPKTASSISYAHQMAIVAAMYGTKSDDITSVNWDDGSTLPSSFMDLPMMMPLYFCHYANKERNSGNLGWQNIQRHIHKVDASSLIGKTIVEYSYSPKHGLLTCPWTSVWGGRHKGNYRHSDKAKLSLYEMDQRKIANDYMMDIDTGVKTDIELDVEAVTESTWKRYYSNDKERYFSVIEVGQYIQKGIGNFGPCTLQPSVHIGISPVPQLTTVNTALVPDHYTDVECTWDVDVEMHVDYGIPYHYTHFQTPHVELEDTYMCMENENTGITGLESMSSFQNKHLGLKHDSSKATTSNTTQETVANSNL
ncbi:uncharacterized protein LOC112603426 [Melanaphis sacchari]|uniref:uncharacterized protein LOC112603426 n=1 Tax=Melanaphis sacchari TaxID=742174 RepID=UPI000DC14EC9|nr:uncharacterized protein LOC112603426 [Melanaphis sacchari]